MSRPTVSKMNSNDGQSPKISDRNLVDNSIMENSKNAAKLAVNSLDQIGRDQDCLVSGENGTPAYGVKKLTESYDNTDSIEAAIVAMQSNALRDGIDTFLSSFKTAINGALKLKGENLYIYTGYALSMLALVRNSREGVGEKNLYRKSLWMLYCINSNLAKLVLHESLRPDGGFGSWADIKSLWDEFCTGGNSNPNIIDDYTSIVSDILREDILKLCVGQFKIDQQEMDRDLKEDESRKLSLFAKWVPKAGSRIKPGTKSSSKIHDDLAWCLARILCNDDPNAPEDSIKYPNYCLKWYRVRISAMNRELGTVEVDMSRRRFQDIKYESVPAGARNLYQVAFKNEKKDGSTRSDLEDRILGAERNRACINRAAETGKGIKAANAGVLSIVSDMLDYAHEEPSVEQKREFQARWNVCMTDIKKKIRMSSNSTKELEKNLALVCLDTSASMTWYGGMPEKAGLAMTLVATELVSEPWKNRYMSFTTNPTWHRLPKGDITKDDIWNRFKVARTGPIGGSTNFAKLLDLLLNTLKKGKVPPEGCPKTIVIFSDMQVDQANSGVSETLVQSSRRKFIEAGYPVPLMILWNLRSTGTTPVTPYQEGVISVSGYSENMFRLFIDGTIQNFTPWSAAKDCITVPWTLNIRNSIKDVLSGSVTYAPNPWEDFWSSGDTRWKDGDPSLDSYWIGVSQGHVASRKLNNLLPPPPPESADSRKISTKKDTSNGKECLNRRKSGKLKLVDGKMIEIYYSNRLELDSDEAIKRWNSSDVPDRYEIVDEIEYPIYKKPKEMVDKSDVLNALAGLDLSKDDMDAIASRLKSTMLSYRTLKESGFKACEM